MSFGTEVVVTAHVVMAHIVMAPPGTATTPGTARTCARSARGRAARAPRSAPPAESPCSPSAPLQVRHFFKKRVGAGSALPPGPTRATPLTGADVCSASVRALLPKSLFFKKEMPFSRVVAAAGRRELAPCFSVAAHQEGLPGVAAAWIDGGSGVGFTSRLTGGLTGGLMGGLAGGLTGGLTEAAHQEGRPGLAAVRSPAG